MSDVIPHKRALNRSHAFRVLTSPPDRLEFGEGNRPVIQTFSDGTRGRGTCLGCHDAPCMNISSTETDLPGRLAQFPGDPSTSVCPTDAISWNTDLIAIEISADNCIGCGLCAARCPYGAIHISGNGIAVATDSDPDAITKIFTDHDSPSDHPTPLRQGKLGFFPSPLIRIFPETISSLSDLQSSQLVRNLLIQLGFSCRIRRRGDTNVRIDAVAALPSDSMAAAVEIELSNAVLESPRSLVEDVAVLHGRYDIPTLKIHPLSIILSLPNARSEYYQVIDDIQNVLELRCRTITVGALLFCVWHFLRLTQLDEDLFTTTFEGANFTAAMRSAFGLRFDPLEPFPASLKTAK